MSTSVNLTGFGLKSSDVAAIQAIVEEYIRLNGGGGASTFAALSDNTTADLPAVNSPLAAALAGKVTKFAPVLLGAGPTNITVAAHANRAVSSDQAGATSVVFANGATSGATGGELVAIRNTGAGLMTASGTISASTGFKLTASQGESIIAEYVASEDAWFSSTPNQSGGTLNPLLFMGSNITVPNDTVENLIATITVPAGAMGPNGWINFEILTTRSADGVGAHRVNVKWDGTIVDDAHGLAIADRTYMMRGSLYNQNAANAQIGYSKFGSEPGSNANATLAVQTYTVDTSVAKTLTLYSKNASAESTTIKIAHWTVRVYYGA